MPGEEQCEHTEVHSEVVTKCASRWGHTAPHDYRTHARCPNHDHNADESGTLRCVRESRHVGDHRYAAPTSRQARDAAAAAPTRAVLERLVGALQWVAFTDASRSGADDAAYAAYSEARAFLGQSTAPAFDRDRDLLNAANACLAETRALLDAANQQRDAALSEAARSAALLEAAKRARDEAQAKVNESQRERDVAQRERNAREVELADARRLLGAQHLGTDSSDLAEARRVYFKHGGVESDIGGRAESSWYWRRVARLLDMEREQMRVVLKPAEQALSRYAREAVAWPGVTISDDLLQALKTLRDLTVPKC